MIGKNLISLAKAMAEHEGWTPDDLNTPNQNEETLAVRNNNPGNLTYSPFAIGKKGRFAYFYNEEVGFMALLWDLFQKCSGRSSTRLHGNSTLEELIKVYAPPIENNTENYLKYIEMRTGFKRQMRLVELLAK